MQSVATTNFHWSFQERAVAVAWRGEPNFYWLLRGPSAGSRGALQRLARLLDEEEEEAGGGREAFVDSSGGILELA